MFDQDEDDLNEHERLIKEAAERMQARGAPDTAIEQFVQRGMQRLYQNSEDQRKASPEYRKELGVGMARGIAQGATFNFADELEGLARSVLTKEGRAQPLGDSIDQVRGEQAQFRADEPGLAVASELAGSVIPGMGAANLIKRGIGAAQGANLAARGANVAARVSATGAGAGALAGAGSGEGGVVDRLPSAAGGAAVGAIAGYAGGKAVQALQAGGRAAVSAADPIVEKVRAMRGGSPMPSVPRPVASSTAVPVVAAAGAPQMRWDAETAKIHALLQGAGKTAADLAPNPDAPERMVVDVLGRPGGRVARGIRSKGGAASETVDNAFHQRQMGQQERLTKGLYGQRTEEDVFQTADDLIQAQQAQAKPLYEKAYAHGAVDDAEINRILQNPRVARLWDKATAIAEQEALASSLGGKPTNYVMPKLRETVTLPDGTTEEVVRNLPDVKALDYLKRAMDDEVESLASQPNAQRAMKELRTQMLNRLDRTVPAYKTARATWAGDQALNEAFADGKKALSSNVDPRVIRRAMDGMSASERELYQRGAIDGLRVKLEGVRNSADLAGRLNNTTFKKQVREVYGSEADRVLALLEDEIAQANLGHFVQGGSNTPDKLADMAQEGLSSGTGTAISQGLRGNYLDMMVKGGLAGYNKVAGITGGKSRSTLAGYLTQKLQPGAANDALRAQLEAYAKEGVGIEATRRGARSVAGAAAGRNIPR